MERLPSGIQYRHWPVTDAKACVLLVHGLAEHTGRYHRLASRFNDAGIAVVGPDHIGHGASPGVRAHVRRFSEYLEPLTALRKLIGEWYPGTPVFLLGHSMGGLISAHALLDEQQLYRGAMFSGPAFSANPVSALVIWIGRLLRYVLPKMGMLALNDLPKPYHPVFNTERFALASRDRYFLIIASEDDRFDAAATQEFLEGLGPVGVYEVEN